MKDTLTPADVRNLFDYANGLLYWAICPAHKCWVGAIAGHDQATNGACVIQYLGKKYQRSRLVWAWHYGQWPKGKVQHINRTPFDDRIENLSNPAVKVVVKATGGRQMSLDFGLSAPPLPHFARKLGINPGKNG